VTTIGLSRIKAAGGHLPRMRSAAYGIPKKFFATFLGNSFTRNFCCAISAPKVKRQGKYGGEILCPHVIQRRHSAERSSPTLASSRGTARIQIRRIKPTTAQTCSPLLTFLTRLHCAPLRPLPAVSAGPKRTHRLTNPGGAQDARHGCSPWSE
jgi:hypothetical protein